MLRLDGRVGARRLECAAGHPVPGGCRRTRRAALVLSPCCGAVGLTYRPAASLWTGRRESRAQSRAAAGSGTGPQVSRREHLESPITPSSMGGPRTRGESSRRGCGHEPSGAQAAQRRRCRATNAARHGLGERAQHAAHWLCRTRRCAGQPHGSDDPVAKDFALGRLPGAALRRASAAGTPCDLPFTEPASGEQGSTLSIVSRSGLCARPTGAALGGARARPLGCRQRQGPPPKVLRRERLESLTTQSLSRRRPAHGKPSGEKCLHFRGSIHAGIQPPYPACYTDEPTSPSRGAIAWPTRSTRTGSTSSPPSTGAPATTCGSTAA